VAGLGAVPRLLEIYSRLDQRPETHTRFEVVSHLRSSTACAFTGAR